MENLVDKEEFLRSLGNRIRELREKKGISQEHLAGLLNSSQEHISKVENGLREPGIVWLFTLSKC